MASLSDILTTIQNGVVALNDFGKQVKGSLLNISGQLAALNAATYVNSFKTRTGAVVPAQGDYPTSLIPGTATNDNAAAGNLGEYIESVITTGSAVALTSGAQKTVTSIPLTAGDWDVDVICYQLPAATTSVTRYVASLSLVTNVIDATPGRFSDFTQAATVSGGTTFNNAIPSYRLSLAAPTTVYLVALVLFTVSTLSSYGLIRARRPR